MAAEDGAHVGVGEIDFFLSAREGDIEQSAFFFIVDSSIIEALVREEALLEAGDKHVREFESL